MLKRSAAEILAQLSDDAVVLDVGGWAAPFARADWVLDLLPYETRGLYGDQSERGRERFSQGTWVSRDICDRQPWPFADNQFDFVTCAHVLEDVRDPVWVCAELARVARAGYVEVPSRLDEQSYGFQGPWVGWGHHHWLIDIDADHAQIDFVFKHHVIHGRESDHFPLSFHRGLSDEQRVQWLWWEGSFTARERIFTDAESLDPYLSDFVTANLGERHETRSAPALRRALRRLRG